MIRRLEATYQDRHIEVVNHWFKGLTLFIDGEIIAHDNRLVHMDRDEPFITHTLETQSGEKTLNIFVEAIWNIKIAITVDGELIATTHPEAVSA